MGCAFLDTGAARRRLFNQPCETYCNSSRSRRARREKRTPCMALRLHAHVARSRRLRTAALMARSRRYRLPDQDQKQLLPLVGLKEAMCCIWSSSRINGSIITDDLPEPAPHYVS